jgi:hypothetical protein
MTKPRQHEPVRQPSPDQILALIGEYGEVREQMGVVLGRNGFGRTSRDLDIDAATLGQKSAGLLALIDVYGELRERIGVLMGNGPLDADSARAVEVGVLREDAANLFARIGARLLRAEKPSAAEATVQFRAGHRGDPERVQGSIQRRGNCADDGLCEI